MNNGLPRDDVALSTRTTRSRAASSCVSRACAMSRSLGDVAASILDAKLPAGAPILARRRGPERKIAAAKAEEKEGDEKPSTTNAKKESGAADKEKGKDDGRDKENSGKDNDKELAACSVRPWQEEAKEGEEEEGNEDDQGADARADSREVVVASGIFLWKLRPFWKQVS